MSAIDYLLIGHLTEDLTPAGAMVGGTAAYAGLTAQALGMKTGLVTSYHQLNLPALDGIQIINHQSEQNTTFENLAEDGKRIQFIFSQANLLKPAHLPSAWQNPAIVHLAPVIGEVDEAIAELFPQSLVVTTPQGWMRQVNAQNRVQPQTWLGAETCLKHCHAAIFSIEDICGDEDLVEAYAGMVDVLVVTESKAGCRLYWRGDVRYFKPHTVTFENDTGAGDIFAAAFFHRLHATRNPWEAARFATCLAAQSVTRTGLSSIPTRDEIIQAQVEIIETY